MIVDCDKLPGHWKAICHGTHRKRNGRGHSLADRQFLLGKYLHVPVGEIELVPNPGDALPSSGIGDRLKDIVAREAGATPCGECKDEIARLNYSTVDQVRQDREAIALRIVDRAKTRAKNWWQRWGARLAPGFAKSKVLGWIDEACGQKAEPSKQPLPINRIVTAVRTARRDEPTLQGTLASMSAAGFESPVIFSEPDAVTDVASVRWQEQKGAFRGFIDHAKWLLANTDGAWFLLCEDDVTFAAGLADRLRELPITNEIVTLFKPAGLAVSAGPLAAVKAVNGSLAVLISREWLSAIVASRAAAGWKKRDCVDRFISAAAREIGAKILSPNQSLVQHVGRTSVCQPKRWATNSLTHRMRYASDFAEAATTTAGLVTLITPTGDRPDAFRLCERWMSQQRYSGAIQWIVIDDGAKPTTCTRGQEYIHRRRGKERHSLCANLREAIPHIRGQHVLIIEDDDYYGPDYVSMMVGALQRADLVGEVGAKYYYLRHRKWRHRHKETWASLCRTGMNARVLKPLRDAAEGTHPSVDLRLWRQWKGSQLQWVDVDGNFRGCVGIKGVAGRQSRGWRPVPDAVRDREWRQLKLWIGDDWTVYRDLANALTGVGIVAAE